MFAKFLFGLCVLVLWTFINAQDQSNTFSQFTSAGNNIPFANNFIPGSSGPSGSSGSSTTSGPSFPGSNFISSQSGSFPGSSLLPGQSCASDHMDVATLMADPCTMKTVANFVTIMAQQGQSAATQAATAAAASAFSSS